MIEIRRHKQRKVPTLNMTSMPDLIFTVLFFFMIVTHMRSESPKLKTDMPSGTELSKPTHKRTIVNLYVGLNKSGQALIQIGEKIVPLNKVGPCIQSMKDKLNDDDAALFTVNIRADKHIAMGVISDIKQELRKCGALNIRYNALENKNE